MTEVKIDKELHKKVIRFIRKGENRFNYPNIKFFIDKAVLEKLEKVEREEEAKKLNLQKEKEN